MEPTTWNLFVGNDLLVAIVGFVGVTSATIVLMTAFTNIDRRERKIKSDRK
jgi:hypothetical protein